MWSGFSYIDISRSLWSQFRRKGGAEEREGEGKY
jgi:hypothetical protein